MIKRIHFGIVLALACFSLQSQNLDNRVTLVLQDVTLPQVLSEIESITSLKFFYLDSFMNQDIFSLQYDNTSLKIILDDLLVKKDLNFFLLKENQVIITKNDLIYDTLPKSFYSDVLGDTSSLKVENSSGLPISPILINKEDINQKEKVETIRIGRMAVGASEQIATVTGTVIRKSNGEPIPDLQMIIQKANILGITGVNGSFKIELPIGVHLLEMRALGIKKTKKRLIVFSDGKLNFELEENLEVLDEVVVSADALKNVTETSSGSERIDAEESKNIPLALGERDVLRVAAALPGISAAGEGALGFNVRGGKSDQNLVLLDNSVIYNPQHFFGVFSALNPSAIEEFSVYKGSMPAEYGGRLSSVFEIKSKKDIAAKVGGELSLGPVTSNVMVETPLIKDKASLFVAGRGAYANWILRSLDEPSLNRSQASFYDGTLSYNHKINKKNTLKVTTYLSRDDFSITSDSLYIYQNRLISTQWNHVFNDKNTMSVSLANSQYDFNIEFDGNANNDFLFGYKVDESELKLNFNYVRNRRLSFKYGISGKLYRIDPGEISPLNTQTSDVQQRSIDREKAIEAAAYLSAEAVLTDKLTVEAGLRYSVFMLRGGIDQFVYEDGLPKSEATIRDTLSFDDRDIVKTYANPEFRSSLRYLLSPNLSVKAGYGKTFQYIHRLSNNTTVSPIDTWKLSDLNIKPQQADQYTLGFFKNLEENSFELGLEGFYKRFDNILDFKTGAQIILNDNIATETLQGEGESYGVEFLLRKNTGKLNGWLGYTYSRSLIRFNSMFAEERINNGAFFPSNFDRPHDLSLIANYKFSRRFSLSTNFVYQTGRPVTVPVGNFSFDDSEFVVFSDRNSFRIPDFYRLDIGFNIEGNHKKKKFGHSFWTLSVYNVLGRNNPFSVFFVADDGSIQGLQTSIFTIPVPSITYNLKF
ncbi:MAG: TonB-dependent receptor plug domain-containing protein [Bacteroidota bacterium]